MENNEMEIFSNMRETYLFNFLHAINEEYEERQIQEIILESIINN